MSIEKFKKSDAYKLYQACSAWMSGHPEALEGLGCAVSTLDGVYHLMGEAFGRMTPAERRADRANVNRIPRHTQQALYAEDNPDEF